MPAISASSGYWKTCLLLLTVILLAVYVKRKEGSLEDVLELLKIKKTPVFLTIDLDEGHRKERLTTLAEIYSIPHVTDDVYKLNESLSRTIDLDRPPNDLRPEKCKSITYDINNLPTISIILPIYNEGLSMVLRTVHSAINHTPKQLLSDIILVDDQSKYENLKEPLDRYLKYLPPIVKVVRNEKREGLIRSRMRGVEKAEGEVLLFQDAHTEFSPGWAEPILEYIRLHPSTVVQPTVEELHDKRISWPEKKYPDDKLLWRGVFLWDMRFAWNLAPKKYNSWQLSEIDPYPNPVLVGCSLAVGRKYFHDIGGFDSGLNIWGGENIELSLRTWMCGGQMVILPCSRIAHVFKPFSYSFDGDKEKIVGRNSIRVVETWMDEFRDYYYASNFVYPFKRVELSDEDKEGLRERKKLREQLKCKPFRWYLENILPEMATPPKSVRFFGEIQNFKSKSCFKELTDGYIALTSSCFTYSRLIHDEEYGITEDGKLLHNGKCVVVQNNLLLKAQICGSDNAMENGWSLEVVYELSMQIGKLKFEFEDKKVRCAQQVTNILEIYNDMQMPQLTTCDDSDWQKWYISYNLDYSLVPQRPL